MKDSSYTQDFLARALALAGMARLVGMLTHNRRLRVPLPVRAHTYVAGLVPSLVCTVPGLSAYERQLINAFPSHRCFFLSLPLSLKAMRKCPQVRIMRKKKTWALGGDLTLGGKHTKQYPDDIIIAL